MRRCGQLGIPHETAIKSRFFAEQGLGPNNLKIAHRDGLANTFGWGDDKRPIEDKHTTPHDRNQLLKLLASGFQSDRRVS
jgi:hypothetical protein